MSLIIDASLALAWCFDDERTEAADALLDRVARTGALVPSPWRLEVANALLAALRRKRIDKAFRDASLADLDLLDIKTDGETDLHAWSATLRLAERHGLSLYDAAYLELAERRRLPLATLDAALTQAAASAGVETLPSPG